MRRFFKIFRPFTGRVARAAFANRFRSYLHSTMTETVAETVKDVPEEKWETLIEGKAKILHRPGEAFYNPAQVATHCHRVVVYLYFKMEMLIFHLINSD